MISKGWTHYKISELLNAKALVIGDGYRAKNSELCSSKSGLPFARAGNINQGFWFDNADYLASNNLSRAGEKISEPGDVLFTSKGTVGRVAFVSSNTPKFVYSPQLTWWRVKDCQLITPRFLYYWMHGWEFCSQVNAFRGQTDMADYVSLRDQREMMYITLPSLDEQKEIAHILGTLDDKIELNQQMNRTLEGIAHDLFKSWFIDFDPVRAKLDGRQPAGMDAETAALFPDSFEDSPLGKIPKGWEFKAVEDLVEGVYDGPHATPKPSETGPVFLGIRNFTGTSLELTNIRHINEEDWPRWTKRVTPQTNDIVFTYEATLGCFALIPDWLHCCLGRRTALIRPKAFENNAHFLFHVFTGNFFQEFLNSRINHGSTVDRILLKEFPSYPVLWPGNSLASYFEDVVNKYWKLIHNNQRQNQELTAIRDILLPKLLSGEVRLATIEDLIGDAA